MTPDEELCRQLQQGSEAALEALVLRHHAAIQAYLTRLSGDRHVAEDLAQECFVRLCTRATSYRYPEPFVPWLYTIAHNLYRDWRKGAYQRRVDLTEPPDGPNPVDLYERQVQRLEIAHALAELDELHRAVLILRYYHDLKVDEIAAVVGIPPGTVKSRLHHAVRLLGEQLHTEGRERHAKGPAR